MSKEQVSYRLGLSLIQPNNNNQPLVIDQEFSVGDVDNEIFLDIPNARDLQLKRLCSLCFNVRRWSLGDPFRISRNEIAAP